VETNDQKPSSKYDRRFDEEFKRDAVRMLESRVRMAEQLVGELGVSVWSRAAADAAAPRGRINSFDGRGKKWVSF
jgi:hypothetical protein